MFSALKKYFKKEEKSEPLIDEVNSGDAENELLDDLIDAMHVASLKGMTDQEISSIISQAACQVGINLTAPTAEEEMSSNEVMTYLRSFAQHIRKANKTFYG